MASTIEMESPRIGTMDFTEKLNRACKLRRLTNQRELADLARVSKSSLNRWIAGESLPSVVEAVRLAKVLEVSLDWLASDDDHSDPPQSDALPDDEESILRLYRSLKRTGALDEDAALTGLATAAGLKAWNPGSVQTFNNLGPKLPPKPRREPEAPPTEPPVRVSGKLPPKKTKSG